MDYKKSIESVEFNKKIVSINQVVDSLKELEDAYINVVNSPVSSKKKVKLVKNFAREIFGEIYNSVHAISPEDVDKLAEVLKSKNSDYGDSFGRGVKLYGAYGMTLRISDKVHRLQTLMSSASTPRVDESLQDTLVDILGYLVLTYTYSEKE